MTNKINNITRTTRTTRTTDELQPRYDAVVVGARAAGAATAMLLARRGLDVLAIDRSGYGTDTLSSHALMRGAVTQLERWDIAERLRAETPAITTTNFRYGSDTFSLDNTSEGTQSPLMAPRRTLLDRSLVDASRSSGATVKHHTKLRDLIQDSSGRVTGVVIENDAGVITSVDAGIVIGADGLNSTVARRLNVPITRSGVEASAYVLRYVEHLDLDDSSYHWLYGHEVGGGCVPTIDGQHIVFAAMPRSRFRGEIRSDVAAGFDRVLREIDTETADVVRSSTPAGPFRTFPGHVGQFRQAVGPGWALVGDAGYFKDPFAAHGISDAFRDAELLADAVLSGDLGAYERARDELSAPLFDVLEEIASYRWTIDELPAIHYRLSKTMTKEQRELTARRDRTVVATTRPLATSAA